MVSCVTRHVATVAALFRSCMPVSFPLRGYRWSGTAKRRGHLDPSVGESCSPVTYRHRGVRGGGGGADQWEFLAGINGLYTDGEYLQLQMRLKTNNISGLCKLFSNLATEVDAVDMESNLRRSTQKTFAISKIYLFGAIALDADLARQLFLVALTCTVSANSEARFENSFAASPDSLLDSSEG